MPELLGPLQRLPRYLSQVEVGRLFEAIPAGRDRLLFGLIYLYGLRVGEVALLRVGDVDLARSRILIRRLKRGAWSERPIFQSIRETGPSPRVGPLMSARAEQIKPFRCERVLLPFMGDLPIDQVSAATLFAYRNHLVSLTSRRGRPLSRATVRMFLGDARAVLNHALTLQVLDRSPIPRNWLPKLPECAPDVLSREEQATLRTLPGESVVPCGSCSRPAFAGGSW